MQKVSQYGLNNTSEKTSLVEWNNYFDKYGYKLINKRNDLFWKVFGITGMLLIILITLIFSWLIYIDKLDGLVQSVANINNEYAFAPLTNNQYNHTIENNLENSFNFQFNLDDELIRRYCNES